MNRPVLVLLSVLALGGVSSLPASAQLVPPLVPPLAPQKPPLLPGTLTRNWGPVFQVPAPDESRKRNHFLSVKNVPASLMAYWLDPKNNARPLELGIEKTPRNSVAAGVAAAAGGFVLPAGVDRIIAIDPQNSVLVFGTDAGADELEKTMTFLDQPQRFVEIEVKWVEVKPQDARAFGIEYLLNNSNFPGVPQPTLPANSGPQLGMVRGNFAANLAALVAQNRARVLSSPRVVTTNNQPASLNSFAPSSAAVNFKGDAQGLAPFFEGTTQIGLEFGLDVTPTINNDNTITVLAATSSKLKIKTAGGNELSSAEPLNSLQTVTNVRDGDTIALGGFSSQTTSTVKGAAQNPLSNLMIFLTARIVRTAEK